MCPVKIILLCFRLPGSKRSDDLIKTGLASVHNALRENHWCGVIMLRNGLPAEYFFRMNFNNTGYEGIYDKIRKWISDSLYKKGVVL